MSKKLRAKDLDAIEERIAQLEQKTKNLTWEAEDIGGRVLIGMHDEVPLFRISRGTLIYTLNIMDEDVKERNRIKFSTSTQINRLKNKADSICEKHYIPHLKSKK